MTENRGPEPALGVLVGLGAAIVLAGLGAVVLLAVFYPYDARPHRRSEGPFRFDRPAADPWRPPHTEALALPAIAGGNAIWGATGRDRRGRIWFGVSCAGPGSAHLVEFDPVTGRSVDRGGVLAALRRLGRLPDGLSQAKIHSRIVEGPRGALYFTSMDEQGEDPRRGLPPRWGSRLWRYEPRSGRWQLLARSSRGWIALERGDRCLFLLGYWGHELTRYDLQTGEIRSVEVGAPPGHTSRNLIADARDHVWVPRVGRTEDGRGWRTELVEFDAALARRAATPLEHYLPRGRRALASHGITALCALRDGGFVFLTHPGRLYRIEPARGDAPGRVRDLGWFHPRGSAYAASLFTYARERYVMGMSWPRVRRRGGAGMSWVVFDLETGTRRALAPGLPPTLARERDLLLYGSMAQDDEGRCYLGGTSRGNGGRPVAVRVAPAR